MILNRFCGFFRRDTVCGEFSAFGFGEKIMILGSIIFATGIPWSHVFGYIGAGIVLSGGVITRSFFSFRARGKTLIILLLALCAWGVILSSTVAIRPSYGLQTVFAYFAHWLIPFVIGFWIPLRYKTRMIYLWMISLFVLGFISFLAFTGFYHAPSFSKEGMLFGLHNHIQFAALLLLGFNILYGLFLTPFNSKKTTVFLSLSGALFLLFLILTGSRGWWVAAVVSIGGMTIHHILANRSRKTAMILVVAGVLFAAGSVAIFPQVRARINRTGFNDPNYLHRRNMAVMAWEVIRDNPITGIGPGQTPFAKKYYDIMENMNLPQETGYMQKKHFHNIYLQIAAEFGLPGLMLFLSVLFWSYKVMFSSPAKNVGSYESGIRYGVLWSFVALAVAEFFDCLLRGPAVAMEYFWILGVCGGFYPDKVNRNE